MASIFTTLKSTVNSLLSVVQTTASVVDTTMLSAQDMAQVLKANTAAYLIEVELLKQKRIDILSLYKAGSSDKDTTLAAIKELSELIAALEAANEAAEV